MRSAWIGAAFVLFSSAAGLSAADSVTALEVTNPGNYVLQSDADDDRAGYNRDLLNVEAEVTFNRDGAPAEETDYRLSYRILDDEGNPVAQSFFFDPVTGQLEPVFVQTEFTTVDFGSSSTVQRSFSERIPSWSRLDHTRKYTVNLTVERDVEGDGEWAFRADAETDPAYYYHFINTDPDDAADNVLVRVEDVSFNRAYLVDTIDGKETFEGEVHFALWRWDRFDRADAPQSKSISVTFDYVLREAGSGDEVPLTSGTTTASRGMFEFLNVSPREPYSLTSEFHSFEVELEEGVQLDSANEDYVLEVTASHVDEAGADPVVANTRETPAQRLLHFNGTLLFGGITATFDALGNIPQPGATGMGYVASQLEVLEDGGRIDGNESYLFSEDAVLDVQLLANGDAQVVGGEVGAAPDTQDEEVIFGEAAGWRFRRSGLVLSSSGLTGDVLLSLPMGLGYRRTGSMEDLFGPRAYFPLFQFSSVAYTQSLGPLEDSLERDLTGEEDDAWFFDQSWPVAFRPNRVTWNVDAGQFVLDTAEVRYVHEIAMAYPEASEEYLENPEETDRPSNERYFRFVNGSEGDAVFETAAGGGVRSSFTLLLGGGDYQPHFPRDHRVEWNGTGRIEVADGRVDPSGSYLDGVAPIELEYVQDCPAGSCDGGSGSGILEFEPDGDRLAITRNGGLHGRGVLAVPAELQWGFVQSGVFAHETDVFMEAAYHASGVRLEGNEVIGGSAKGAAAIHLAGIDPDTLTAYELPETQAYRTGSGDYAGVNFRVSDEAATLEGRSRIGGEATRFDLTARSKYYVRRSGVSGIHEAEPGTFPGDLQIYGYDFAFTNYGLSFLSSEVEESRTNGQVSVPHPSDFVQDFEELTLTCLGELDRAETPEADEEKRLAYWAADFQTRAIRFAREPENCPTTSVLALGVETGAAAFEAGLAGELGFHPNGELTSPADADVEEGLDSRLHVADRVRIEGPQEETYLLEPVAKPYFNSHAVGSNAGIEAGFLSLAGLVDVPFFEAVQIQVHTRGRNPTTEGDAPYLAGGWPDRGWKDGDGNSYFSDSGFDPEHRGFPQGVSLSAYRGAPGGAVKSYLVRARQDWLGVVSFDYPLTWDRTTRSFRSFAPESNDLLVLNVEHQVDYLSAENAEVSFGARYDGLPRISLASAAFNAIDETTGVAQSLAESAQAEVRDAVVDGMDDLSALLRDRMDELLEETLFSLTDEAIDEMFDELESRYETLRSQGETIETWRDETDGYVAVLEDHLFDLQDDVTDPATTSKLIEELEKLSQGIDQGVGVLREVDRRLRKVQVALDALVADVRIDGSGNPVPDIDVEAFETWLQDNGVNVAVDRIVDGIPVDEDGRILSEVDESDVEQWLAEELGVSGGEWMNGLLDRAVEEVGGELEEGSREILQRLVRRLFHNLAPDVASNFGPALDDLSSSLNEDLNALLEDAEPAIEKIVDVLERVRDRIGEFRAEMAKAEGLAEEIQDEIDAASEEINRIARGVRERTEAFFDQYEAARPASAEDLADDFSPFEEYGRDELKQLVREELRDLFFASELAGEIHTALKQRIYDLDAMVREAVDSAFQRVNGVMRDLVEDAVAGIDDEINGMLGDLSDLVGAGEIDGYAHINGDALRRLRLDGRFEWQVPDEVDFRGYLLVEQLNSEGTEGCQFDDVDGSVTEVTLGALDVGFAGLGDGGGMSVDVETKFSFATDPFLVRGLAGSVVLTEGQLEFEAFAMTEFGAAAAFGPAENYLSASTRLQFSEYELAGGIFFGRTCTLDPILLWDPEVGKVVTNGGPFTGGYVYGEGWIPITEAVLGIPATCMFNVSAGVGAGAFYFVEGPTFGGKIMAGLSGEALCVVSVKGELRMSGAKQGGELNLSGQGSVSGKAGKCPFCVEFGKTINATFQSGQWDIEL